MFEKHEKLYNRNQGTLLCSIFFNLVLTMECLPLRTIDLLEMNGPLLREPYSKPLENGIFELRTKQGSDITRVLYFFIVGKKAVLINGFIKKSQKTPKAEKELAKRYKADYERRYGNE